MASIVNDNYKIRIKKGRRSQKNRKNSGKSSEDTTELIVISPSKFPTLSEFNKGQYVLIIIKIDALLVQLNQNVTQHCYLTYKFCKYVKLYQKQF